MDERSEEEFHLHESDDELANTHVHRDYYPDPEDDGLLHHAPTHQPPPSPEHYKVPSSNNPREYVNMDSKQNGGCHGEEISPYMNGHANTYSHKLNGGSSHGNGGSSRGNDEQYAHLNRSYSKNRAAQHHNYLNLP